MTRSKQPAKGRGVEVEARGVRRKDVDLHQLALVYYLLAKRHIEEQRAAEAGAMPSHSEAA